MASDNISSKHILDLANRAYRNNIYCFTNFLTPAEYSDFLAMRKELPPITYEAFGGNADAERMLIRFGSQEDFGYEEEFPICCLEVRPANMKFAEDFTHRDLLGALMHLGMERDMLGDMVVKDKVGYVFCLEKMESFIMQELTKVRHTLVNCKRVDRLPESFAGGRESRLIQAESLRIDGVIAKVFRLSRSEVVTLFREKKILVNSVLEENNSRNLKEGEMISVRGYGKFTYLGVKSISKKGKNNIEIELFTG